LCKISHPKENGWLYPILKCEELSILQQITDAFKPSNTQIIPSDNLCYSKAYMAKGKAVERGG